MTKRINYSLLARDYTTCSQWIKITDTWFERRLNRKETHTLKKTISSAKNIIHGETTLILKTIPCKAKLKLLKLQEAPNGVMEEKELETFNGQFIETILPSGNYLFKVFPSDGCASFNYPFHAPMGKHDLKLNLEIPPSIPKGMAYIPAGKFFIGGTEARNLRLHQHYLPGFFIKKYEVTFKEYIEFWKQLDSSEKKELYMSKVRFSRKIRAFTDAWDDAGNLNKNLSLLKPVVGITKGAAEAYCKWLSKKTEKNITLPSAYQWEKAARGTDARKYVWGNQYHENFAYTVENKKAAKEFGYWAIPGSLPHDISIYGVYDLAGNVREYTSSKFEEDSPFYQVKGASSSTSKRFLFCSYSSDTPVVPSDIGFRYVMPFEPKH